MKKKMMALAMLVLAVVVTGYSVSGTYAKYTSTAKGSDSARVARWGVGNSITVDLFSDSYDETGSTTVDANGTKVVAPGTSGSYEFTLAHDAAGDPEVSYELTVDATVTDGIGQIVYSLDDEDYDLTAGALESELKAIADTVNVGDDAPKHKIYWKWVYEDSTHKDANSNGIDDLDETDTALGNAASATVKIEVTVTATQID